MQLSISLILASGVFFAVDAIAAHKHVEDGEEDGLREEPDEVPHAAGASQVKTHTDAAPTAKVTFHERETAADFVREEAEQLKEAAEELTEAAEAKVEALVGELVGGAPEKEEGLAKKLETAAADPTTQEAAADAADVSEGLAPALEHAAIHRSLWDTARADCTGLFKTWTEPEPWESGKAGVFGTGHPRNAHPGVGCHPSKISIMSYCLTGSLVLFALWFVLCKGQPRSQRIVAEGSMSQTPYSPLDICSWLSLKPRAICEVIFCDIFMWGETMVRSGTMSLPVVAVATVLTLVVAPVLSGLGCFYCVMRLIGRIQLRRKLAPADPADLVVTDCLAVCCPCTSCCAVAQETEYLELKANGGKAGTVPDADFQQLLQGSQPDESKPEQM